MRLIDADALKYGLIDYQQKNTDSLGDDYWIVENVLLLIEEMPSIEAEPVRHGHWIDCETENGIHFHKCSECGKRDMYQGTFTDWGGRGFSFYYKRFYCPVCGAKMEEVEE